MSGVHALNRALAVRRIHDVDNNTKLDGLEILQAILHTAPHRLAALAGKAGAYGGAPGDAAGSAAERARPSGGAAGGRARGRPRLLRGAFIQPSAGYPLRPAGTPVRPYTRHQHTCGFFGVSRTRGSPRQHLDHPELIDRVLLEDDLDRDGYLSYVEYVLGRQRDDAQRHAAALQAARARTTRRR
ncbi:Uncharacterized protein GBIM_20625 [Gryllus bimaculatus]|nr:Uncharacterized protein GBIM_20625 [Gryllus bimaculatus]